MNKIWVTLMALVTVGIVYGVTLTADATESVTVPVAALGTVCLVDSSTSECTDKTGEILFGNAVVVNKVGDSIGLILLQLGGNIYRAGTSAPVYLYTVTTTDGETVTATSLELAEIENIESLEVLELMGLSGKLSLVLSDGQEVATTGDTQTFSDQKGTYSYPEPVGEYYITYDGLVLENTDEADGTGSRNIMTAGEYADLELTFYQSGETVDHYKLIEITSTASFEWSPAEGESR